MNTEPITSPSPTRRAFHQRVIYGLMSLVGAALGVEARHLPHVRVGVIQHLPRFLQIGFGLAVLAIAYDYRFQLGVFPRQVAKFILVGDDLAVAEQRRQLFVPFRQRFQFGQE